MTEKNMKISNDSDCLTNANDRNDEMSFADMLEETINLTKELEEVREEAIRKTVENHLLREKIKNLKREIDS